MSQLTRVRLACAVIAACAASPRTADGPACRVPLEPRHRSRSWSTTTPGARLPPVVEELPVSFKGRQDRAGCRVGKRLASAGERGVEVSFRPWRVPVPRSRQALADSAARKRTQLLMAIDVQRPESSKERVVESTALRRSSRAAAGSPSRRSSSSATKSIASVSATARRERFRSRSPSRRRRPEDSSRCRSTGRRSRTSRSAGSTPRACSCARPRRYRRIAAAACGRCSSSAGSATAGEGPLGRRTDQHAEAAEQRCASCAAPRVAKARGKQISEVLPYREAEEEAEATEEPTVVQEPAVAHEERRSWPSRAAGPTVAEGVTTSDAEAEAGRKFVARSASRSATGGTLGRSAWADRQENEIDDSPVLRACFARSSSRRRRGEDLVGGDLNLSSLKPAQARKVASASGRGMGSGRNGRSGDRRHVPALGLSAADSSRAA